RHLTVFQREWGRTLKTSENRTKSGILVASKNIMTRNRQYPVVGILTGDNNNSEQQAMRPAQQVFRVRRTYNKWVGDETLEDFALRFTAVRGRRFSIEQVAK